MCLFALLLCRYCAVFERVNVFRFLNEIYEEFVKKVKNQGINVGTGKFGAHMMVDLTNDGPVTILLESRKEF